MQLRPSSHPNRDSSPKALGFRLRSLLLSQISETLAILQEQTLESIHETRRSLKKIRAMLRLLRRPLGQKVFKKEDSHFRDIHHGLSGLRDEQVQKSLGQHYGVEPPTMDSQEIPVNPLIFNMVSRRLEHGYKRLQRYTSWTFSEPQVWQGLKSLYRKGQKFYELCLEQDHSDNLHAWRKQVKYLENALEVIIALENQLEQSKPAADLLEIINPFAKLSSALGQAHDLAIFVKQHPHAANLLLEEQQAFEKEAWHYGQALYQRSSEAFIAQLQKDSH